MRCFCGTAIISDIHDMAKKCLVRPKNKRGRPPRPPKESTNKVRFAFSCYFNLTFLVHSSCACACVVADREVAEALHNVFGHQSAACDYPLRHGCYWHNIAIFTSYSANITLNGWTQYNSLKFHWYTKVFANGTKRNPNCLTRHFSTSRLQMVHMAL